MGECVGQRHHRQPSALEQHPFPDVGECVGQCHLRQFSALTERIVPDVGECVGQCHRRKPSALEERPFPDVGECVGQCHFRQPGAPGERPFPDVGECVGQCYLRQAGAPGERCGTNATNRVEFVAGEPMNEVHKIGLVFTYPLDECSQHPCGDRGVGGWMWLYRRWPSRMHTLHILLPCGFQTETTIRNADRGGVDPQRHAFTSNDVT